MKPFLPLLLFFFGTLSLSAQSFQFIEEAQIPLPADAAINLPLAEYATLEAELTDLRAQLSSAPLESKTKLAQSATLIQLPLPDGTMRTFRVVESSVLSAGDQARWPQLRTYRVLDQAAPRFQGRIAVTPQGVTGAYNSHDGEVFIEPYLSQQARYHLVYYNSDIVLTPDELPQLACGYEPAEGESALPDPIKDGEANTEKSSTPANMYEFVLALTCTGEYSSLKGGTVEAVLNSFVTAINLANTTYEREVGVRIRLIDNQEALIYLNAGTDPFVFANNGGELLSQVQGAITSAGFPTSAYDMGHVFTAGCTDVGGVVGGNICSIGKDRGVTCHASNNLTAIIRRIFTHEVAHQFATAHSWSNCPGSAGQLASASAFEPGSGSTIMSYAGSCSDQNVAFNNDDYYHGHSVEQFIFYSREGQGAACASIIATDNTEPKVTLNYTDGFYIPISTPFELDAAVADPDGDDITFCWEQLDLGPLSPLGMPTGSAPAFRSFPPTTASNRVFPRLSDVVANTSTDVEVLPTYSRPLTFRCTVRDNNPEIGATVWEDIAFRSTAQAGPFLVTSPNNSSDVWEGGQLREVTWEVANTDNELVDCRTVNIRLSTDGGFTYPITLLENTPNIGSAFVTVPEVTGSAMRIRVEAADNIFFDISNANFRIDPPTEPNYTIEYGPIYQQVCLPETVDIAFSTGAVLDYATPMNLSISNELPAEVVTTFSNNNILPGQDFNLTIDFTGYENYDGPFEVEVAIATSDLDTTYRTVYFDLVDNEYSELELLTPVDGQAGIVLGTDFSWAPVVNADLYDWELSDDAAFSNILDSRYGITATEVNQLTQLDNNTLFYWRVRGTNECGPGEWKLPKVFHTVNVVCEEQESGDTPIVIPGTGPLPTITSQVFVPFNGIISDMNVPNIDVSYQPIQNFWVSLTSPSGTEVRLYNSSCFTTDAVDIGFNDDAPEDIICPPTGGVIYRPAEPLSAFNGENSEGVWTLKVKVIEAGFGAPGQIRDWTLEFCAAGNAAAPSLLTNETLFVPPLMSNPVSDDLLRVTDNEEGPFDLRYTVVSAPEDGILYRIDEELTPGSHFTQATIDAGNLRYQNTNGDATNDAFNFIVEDGTGGFLPVQRFDIVIDDDATVGTDDLVDAVAFNLYPNPTNELVNLQLPEATAQEMPLRIYNISGQQILATKIPAGAIQHQVTTEAWPSGIYLVQLGGRTLKLIKS